MKSNTCRMLKRRMLEALLIYNASPPSCNWNNKLKMLRIKVRTLGWIQNFILCRRHAGQWQNLYMSRYPLRYTSEQCIGPNLVLLLINNLPCRWSIRSHEDLRRLHQTISCCPVYVWTFLVAERSWHPSRLVLLGFNGSKCNVFHLGPSMES